jgi:hypothetical protein
MKRLDEETTLFIALAYPTKRIKRLEPERE